MVRGFLRRLRSQSSHASCEFLEESYGGWHGSDLKRTPHFSHSADSVARCYSVGNSSTTSLQTIGENANFSSRTASDDFTSRTYTLRPNLTQLLYASKYSKLRLTFLAHARKFSFEENVLYMLDFERFRRLRLRQTKDDMISDDLVLNQAQTLIDRYIADSAEYQINIEQGLVLTVLEHMANLDLESMTIAFSRISEHIRTILEQQLFDEFMSLHFTPTSAISDYDVRTELRAAHSAPLMSWSQLKSIVEVK